MYLSRICNLLLFKTEKNDDCNNLTYMSAMDQCKGEEMKQQSKILNFYTTQQMIMDALKMRNPNRTGQYNVARTLNIINTNAIWKIVLRKPTPRQYVFTSVCLRCSVVR